MPTGNQFWGNDFQALIESGNKSSISAPCAPDFILQCHLQQLITSRILTLDWTDAVLNSRMREAWKEFRDGSSPTLSGLTVPFVMKVPRKHYLPLLPYVQANGPKGDFVFQVHLDSGIENFNTFSSFEITFGTMSKRTTSQESRLYVDHLGWEGTGDMFVHIYLPIFMQVILADQGCILTLRIQHCLEFESLVKIYGNNLVVFKTSLSDLDHVRPVDPLKLVPPTKISSVEKIFPPKIGKVVNEPEIN